MRNFQIKVIEKYKNAQFMFKIFLSENPAVYKMMWINIVQPDMPQFTIQRMIVQRNTVLKLEITA